MSLITGTIGNDLLDGTAGDDTLRGLLGDDSLRASLGDDSLDGGDGTDVADYRNLGTGFGIVAALGGNTVLKQGGGGADTLDGIEHLIGTGFADSITLVSGVAWTVTPGRGDDTVQGIGTTALLVDLADVSTAWTVNLALGTATTAGEADTLLQVSAIRTGGGNDTITGSSRDDLFSPGDGSNSIDGGAGTDTLRYDTGTAAIVADLRLASGQVQHGGATDTIAGIEVFGGTALGDSFQGSAADETFQPLSGNDTIIGGGGTDWVSYAFLGLGTVLHGAVVNLATGAATDPWDGADSLSGLSGAEGSELSDTLIGRAGVDVVSWVRGMAGADALRAPSPTAMTVADYSLDPAAVGVNLGTGSAIDGWGSADVLAFIRGVSGSAFADAITGDGRDNWLLGNAGADTLIGADGADTLDGGSGANVLAGGAGNDSYVVGGQADVVIENLGEGTDTVTSSGSFYLYANVESLVLAAAAGASFGVGNELANAITGNDAANLIIGYDGADTLLGNGGDDTLYGGTGDDTLSGGSGADYLVAGDGADTLAGNDGADVLYGEVGNDSIDGGAGLDYLFGGAGQDTITGGADADVLYGEAGNDSLTGGPDFVFDMLLGGDGADTLDGASGFGEQDYLYGQAGDDTFLVDTPADLVFENPGEGIDTVFATIVGAGFYLFANVENLVLLGATPFGVGNELANALTGNAAANYLLGGGGADTLNGKAGNDVLFGEAGADTFIFERGTGGDVIGDFTPGTDRILLSGLGFTTFAQVQAATVENGGTAAINFGLGDFVVLNGVAKAALSAGDFLFG